jgi:tetratricopeptide (TPR) repeat protein
MISFCSNCRAWYIVDMRRSFLASFILLAAGGMLSGCGGDTIAFTYRGDEQGWKDARKAGRAALAKKDYVTAEAQFAKSVEHARHIQATNPHHLAETLSDLADTYRQEGKMPEAKATYQEVIMVCQRMPTSKDSSELYKRVSRFNQSAAWLNLGNMYFAENDTEKAKEAYKEGLKIDAYRSGMYPTMARLKKAYAELLDKTGEDPALAKRLHEEAKSATEEILDGL